MLKLKAAIYRYLGIYLAQKEELAYLESNDAQISVSEGLEFGLDFDGALGLAIGSWQADHGFYRPCSPLRLKHFKIPEFVIYLHECYLACKHDILR